MALQLHESPAPQWAEEIKVEIKVRETVFAFLVPDTDGTLAIDERKPAHWFVTHIPTGLRVIPPNETILATYERAIAFAQRFYIEAKKLGADFECPDLGERTFLPAGTDRNAFWARVL